MRHRFACFLGMVLIVGTTRAAPITQQAYLKASNTETSDRFGTSVAIHNDTMVIGSRQEDSNATGVNGDEANEVAIDSGAAYVFVRIGTNWSQQAYLKASNTEFADLFGQSVALDGDTLAVGAWLEDSGIPGDENDNSAYNSGAVYVFVRSGTNWTQQAYLKASNAEGGIAGGNFPEIYGDDFGYSIALSGDTLVVGAPKEDSSATGVNGDENDNSAPLAGAAYVFVRRGTNWAQQAYLKASNTDGFDQFGESVTISGDTIVVGAFQEASSATGINGDQTDNGTGSAGAAYVFVRQGTNWSQQAYLKASNTGSGDRFGLSVASSADTAIVGAFGENSAAKGVNGDQNNDDASDSGAAYVFVRHGTNWTQQAYLKASNTEIPYASPYSDWFGYSVAIWGDTVVVGAKWEDSGSPGVDGNQNSNSASNSGAAYVFVRSGTNWSQQAYLKASNPGRNDEFGLPVAAFGNTVAVGAAFEDSAGIGVNGEQTEGAFDAGAVYVFTGVGIAPTLVLVRTENDGAYHIRFASIPGSVHQLQRAQQATGPWETIDTQTVPRSGFLEFYDAGSSTGQSFYRTVQP